jgi:hypothetical protein
MQSKATSVEQYLKELSEERKAVIDELRKEILTNLPAGFEEVMNYGMIGYVVPHTLYPAGYHCDTKMPLPFMNLASQKNHVGVYHMGIYADDELMSWFEEEYPNHASRKLDMGKSCLRLKKMDDIPYALIGELASKMTVKDWIERYEKAVKR